jgi:hypothetical protein
MGVEIQGLAWDADLGLVGAWDHLYDIDTATGAATQIGTGDFTDGVPDAFNGLYGLAAIVHATGGLDADFNNDGTVDAADLAQWQGDFGVNGDSDANGDGDSDGSDFIAWQGSYAATAISAVPEPHGLAIVLLAASLIHWHATRRAAT